MSTATATRVRSATAKGPAQISALVVALFLIVIGIIGFIPGITTGVGDITFAGPYSGALVFNIFQTSVLQNAVHIFFGLIGLGAIAKRGIATKYLVGVGSLFIVFWLYGLLFGNSDFGGNIFPFNLPDFSFNIAFGAAVLILALATSQLALFGTPYETED